MKCSKDHTVAIRKIHCNQKGVKTITMSVLTLFIILLVSCSAFLSDKSHIRKPGYNTYGKDRVISRSKYRDHLEGFWLGQCIANWSGLITEMDKVEPPFYTDEDWGGPDQKSIWGFYGPSPTRTIEYYFVKAGKTWSADDDTDIEYMYQHLLDVHSVSILTSEQIRDGWLHHMYSNEDAPEGENFLWVSNESAYYLMKEGRLPPETSDPEYNPNYEMIDAQLTTEIFGLFAPARPDIALKMAHLPIRTTAKNNAEWAAEFYVIMHSLASYVDQEISMKEKLFLMAEMARKRLPAGSCVAGMYDFIREDYESNLDKDNWESTRDAVYERYQEGESDGCTYTNPFDAGINFAAGLVSLFYGHGDLPRTVQIGSLTGWDSDNPTATWGGLLGFMLGRDGVEQAFRQSGLSDTYWIHRTRRNFPDHTPDAEGEDTFPQMAERGIKIIDMVVQDEMGGRVDLEKDVWYIPDRGAVF